MLLPRVRPHRSGFGFMHWHSSLPFFTAGSLGQSPSWMLREEKSSLRCSDESLVHFFSPNCPNSQQASALLTDVSLPVMPKDKVAREDGKRRSITGTPTGMEVSQAMQGQQPAPSAAAQPAKPLPPSRAFSSAQVPTVGDGEDTLQVRSTNYFTFASQLSLLLAPRTSHAEIPPPPRAASAGAALINITCWRK